MNRNEKGQRERHHFEWMLAGLLCMLLLGPAIRTVAPPQWSNLILSLTSGIAIASIGASLVPSVKGIVSSTLVGGAFAAVGVLGSLTDSPSLDLVTAVGLLAFCLWGIATSLRQVLIGPAVDLNRIAGAVCVYLMMGLAWATAYLLLTVSVEGAFSGLTTQIWPDLIYFSFVTLTTLGYGDISPVAALARSLAYLEAVIGHLYVAILIGGLVGAHLNRRRP